MSDTPLTEQCPRMTAAAKEGRAIIEGCNIEIELTATKQRIRELEADRKDAERVRANIRQTLEDAERYRHMKANATFQDRNGPGLYWYLPRWNRELPIGDRLDAAIDAELARKT